ncbi:MAG: flagellar basal body rod protein FlgB [Pirellulaceae bacterium]|jgi:flagellar basal-body rod protein FlgB|nr:flagellar basal body rod protein FlgB [Pirellulaceae bacterium]
MWNSWINSSALPALEQTAVFTQNRQALLAGNIANMDVPGYKTRDISTSDFQQRLHEAITADTTLSAGRSAGEPPSSVPAMQRVRDVSKQVLLHDGSDVSLEEQVTEIAKNESLHNISIALMRSQFRNLEVAIRESVNV